MKRVNSLVLKGVAQIACQSEATHLEMWDYTNPLCFLFFFERRKANVDNED